MSDNLSFDLAIAGRVIQKHDMWHFRTLSCEEVYSTATRRKRGMSGVIEETEGSRTADHKRQWRRLDSLNR
jgi:hypothetical protein